MSGWRSLRASSIGLTVAAALVGSAMVMGPAAAMVRQPETLAAAVLAAPKYAHGASSEAAARRGIAYLEINAFSWGGPGYVQVWGYTGSAWKPLAPGTQDISNYPTNLPGGIWVCHGDQYTIIRTGPGFNYPARARITHDVVVRSDAFYLASAATSSSHGKDGIGWYRIRWGRGNAWVVSYRVTDSGGCGLWHEYWGYHTHR